MTRKKLAYYEDPSIERTARVEAGRLMLEIRRLRIEDHEPYFHARTIVLAHNINPIAKRYGKEVARRVEAAIMSFNGIDKEVQADFDTRMRIFAEKRWGRLRKRDRICIYLFGGCWSLPPYKKGEPIIMI